MDIFKLGFIKDEDNLQLNKVFQDNKRLREICIDIYPENHFNTKIPFRLLLRTVERNVFVLNDGNRFVLRMNDRFGTYIMNILLSDINECFFEKVDEHNFHFILNIQNIYYRIIVQN